MWFESFDGKKIYVHEWLDVAAPKGVVQIVHGMTEHAARYDAFARFLNEHGYLVVADDHRGHGVTDRDSLGYCAGDMFEDTVRDAGALTAHYQAQYKGLPYFVFGFSYGSFLTQRYLACFGEQLTGVVIAGSSYKKDFEVYLGSFVAALQPKKKGAKLVEKLSFQAYAKKFEDREWLSNDAESNARAHADPLCNFLCSYRFYADFFRGLRGLYTKSYIAALPKALPVLLLAGAQDPVGNMGKGMRKLERFYREKAGMQDVTLKLFEGSRHEFLNERENRAEKWGAPLAFFDRCAAQQE